MKVLVVVDMQNDFITGSLGTRGGTGNRSQGGAKNSSKGCAGFTFPARTTYVKIALPGHGPKKITNCSLSSKNEVRTSLYRGNF